MICDAEALQLSFNKHGVTGNQLRGEYAQIIESYEECKKQPDLKDVVYKLWDAVWALNHYENPLQRYEIVCEKLTEIQKLAFPFESKV